MASLNPYDDATTLRFFQKVRKTRGCWQYTAGKYSNGYGQFNVRLSPGVWTSKRAHRVAWEIQYGPIPDELLVLHHCDNRICVKPTHFFLGNTLANVQDMVSKGRENWHHIGKINPNAILTERNIPRIRRLHTEGMLMKEIAAQYSVGLACISDICRRKTWAHV